MATSRTISEEPLGGEEFLRTEVSYIKGRGYYVAVYPFERIDGAFRVSLTDLMNSALIQGASRFNAQILAQLVPPAETVAALRAKAMAKRTGVGL